MKGHSALWGLVSQFNFGIPFESKIPKKCGTAVEVKITKRMFVSNVNF